MPDEFGNPTDEEVQQLLADQEVPKGFRRVVTPEGFPYFEEIPGAITEPEKVVPTIPLPPVDVTTGAPEVPVVAPEKQTAYDITPAKAVPETPAEQLEKLKPTPAEELAALADPFEAAAARVRRRAPAREPEEAPLEEPKEPRNIIEAATAPERLGAAAFLKHAPRLVYGIPGALADLLAGIEGDTYAEQERPISARRVGGVREPAYEPPMRAIADWLKQAQEVSERGVEKVTLTEGQKPATPLEKASVWTGEYAQPVKGVSAAATVGLAAMGAAVRGGMTRFGPEDVPIPSMVTEAKADPFAGVPTTGTFLPLPGQQGPIKVAPTLGAPTAPAAPTPQGSTVIPLLTSKGKPSKVEGGRVVIPDNVTIPPRDQRWTTEPKLKQGKGRTLKSGEVVGAESDEAFEQRKEATWIAKEVAARRYTPTATATFDFIDQMKKVQLSDYKVIGITGVAAIGAAFAPKLYQRFKFTRIPNLRTVKDAAPGTVAISTPLQYARLADDVNAPLISVASKAGMDPRVLKRVEEEMRISTRNGARALADGAVDIGRIETPSFRFRAPKSLADMAGVSTPNTDRYLRVLETYDDLLASASTQAAMKGTAPVAVKNGFTAQTALQEIKNLEAAYPEVRQMAKWNQQWNREMNRFLSSGEYATLSKADANMLNQQYKNQLGGRFSENAIGRQSDRARQLIKERTNNEAVGLYVDEMNKLNPGYFKKISPQQYRDNPDWHRNVVTFARRGKTEYYTTDVMLADILRTDHHLVTAGGEVIYAAKRLLEMTTTGSLAPNFAPVSAIRSYWISKFTTEQGRKAPTAIGSFITSIPQQLAPQIALAMSRAIERGSGGIFQQLFDKAWLDSFAQRMAKSAMDSVYMQVKMAGAHRGPYVEQAQRSLQMQRITNTINAGAATDPGLRALQGTWNAWKALLESVHNGPGFNYIVRNWGKTSPAQLALESRRLTGDPRAAGQFYAQSGRRAIRYESDDVINNLVANTLVKGYGWTAEQARHWVPWWNPTLQGIKRIGEAYLHDPIRFTRSAVLYGAMPAATSFYWNKYLDTLEDPRMREPNGRSYLDYHLNGRSENSRQMNFYFAWPGKPAENGFDFTFFHELNPVKRLTEDALHHMLGTDNPKDSLLFGMPDNHTVRRSFSDDMRIAKDMFLETAIWPPTHPLINFVLGTQGIRGPQSLIGGGEAFPVKGDPYNQNGGLPTSLEVATRALLGSVAESIGAFYASASQTEDGILSALKNGAMGAGAVYLKRTPFINVVTEVLPDRSNNTDLAKNVFKLQKKFDQLGQFYSQNELKGGKLPLTPASKPGAIAVQEQYELEWLNAGNPGLKQPAPTNPLYIEYMREFYNAFMKESPVMVKGEDQGGVAFKSLWRNYGHARRKATSLKDVNYGNYDRWQREMDPEARDELSAHGVDPTDRRSVVNFYRQKQWDALRVIDYVRRATDERMSAKASASAGKPVRIELETLNPYLTPQPVPEAPFMFPELLGEFGGQ